MADTITKALSSGHQFLPWNVMYAEFVLEACSGADMKSRAEVLGEDAKVLRLTPGTSRRRTFRSDPKSRSP